MSDERRPAVGREERAALPERARVWRTLVTLTRLASGAAVFGLALMLLNFEDAARTDYGWFAAEPDDGLTLGSDAAASYTTYSSSPETWALSPAAYATGHYLVTGGLLVLLVLVVLRLVIRTLNDNTDRLVEAARAGGGGAQG